MIKNFNFRINSLTELVAAKAVLTLHDIGFCENLEKTLKNLLKRRSPLILGNYGRGGENNLPAITYHGYTSGPYSGAVYLPDLNALIKFLENEEYHATRQFKVELSAKTIVTIEAHDEQEAITTALGNTNLYPCITAGIVK